MKAWQYLATVGLLVASLFSRSYAQSAPTRLQLSPSSVDFGENAVETDSPPRTITLTNASNTSVMIEQIIASGIDFSQKHDCGETLAAGAQCTIQVSFTPAITGLRTGSLEVMDADGNPYFVALNGVGR